MTIKAFAIASVFAVVAASGANAADLVQQDYAPAATTIMAPSFSWSGAYIGGQVGYGFGKSKFKENPDPTDPDTLGSGSLKPNGFLGGVYAGYNFDVGNNVILGADGDFNYGNLKKSHSEFDPDLEEKISLESKLQWSGAVRGRVGYAIDRFMPYIAGGVAFGNVKTSLRSGDDSYSSSKTMTGWTIGTGLDYAATDNVILRLEYRYTDFGKKNFYAGSDDTIGISNKFTTNDIRLGVAYKF